MQTNFKKYFAITLLLAILIAPSFALASWWNPISWNVWQKVAGIFYKPQTVQIQTITNQSFPTEQDCEEKTGCNCEYIECDYIPAGKTFEEVCGKDFKKGWQCKDKKVDETTNWKTYTNTEYGFEFKYPSTAQLEINDDYDFTEGCVSINYKDGSISFIGDFWKATKFCAGFTGRGVDNIRIQKQELIIGNKKYYFDGDTNAKKEYLVLDGKLSDRLSLHYSIGFSETIGVDSKSVLNLILSTFKFTK